MSRSKRAPMNPRSQARRVSDALKLAYPEAVCPSSIPTRINSWLPRSCRPSVPMFESTRSRPRSSAGIRTLPASRRPSQPSWNE